MSFKPVRYDSGKVERLPLGSGVVCTKFGSMVMSSGYLAAGSGGENEAEYIGLETTTDTTTSNGGTWVNVLRIDETIEFDATCATTPVQATHVGNDYDFGSGTALDLTATTDKVFHINSITNAANKIVRGQFNKPAL